MSRLRLPHTVFRAIRAHGERAYPFECCGVLLGQPFAEGWDVAESVEAANASAGLARNRYSIAPAELVALAAAARAKGLEIAGFYHSHPDHPAEWSAADLVEAHWIGCAYVITQVEHGEARQTKAFVLAGTREEDKYFELQTIDVHD